jgi:hypothetical protein
VRGLPPCFGITEPSMIIGMDITIVSILVIFISLEICGLWIVGR